MDTRLKMAIAVGVLYTGWYITDKIDHRGANVLAVMMILASLMYNRDELAKEARLLGIL